MRITSRSPINIVFDARRTIWTRARDETAAAVIVRTAGDLSTRQ